MPVVPILGDRLSVLCAHACTSLVRTMRSPGGVRVFRSIFRAHSSRVQPRCLVSQTMLFRMPGRSDECLTESWRVKRDRSYRQNPQVSRGSPASCLQAFFTLYRLDFPESAEPATCRTLSVPALCAASELASAALSRLSQILSRGARPSQEQQSRGGVTAD